MNALILSLAMIGAEAAPERAPDPWTFEDLVAQQEQTEQAHRDEISKLRREVRYLHGWLDAAIEVVGRKGAENRAQAEELVALKKRHAKIVEACNEMLAIELRRVSKEGRQKEYLEGLERALRRERENDP